MARYRHQHMRIVEEEEEEVSLAHAAMTGMNAAFMGMHLVPPKAASVMKSEASARRELLDAVRHGRKEPANPAPDTGAPRWQYTHAGYSYITDETSQQEIVRWPLCIDQKPFVVGDLAVGNFTTHVVFVVDSSGSMRKDDVVGFANRTHAVYNAISTQFLGPQMALMNSPKGAAMGRAVVSLIEMSTDPRVLCNRAAIDDAFGGVLEAQMCSSGRHHGNYIPALEAVHDLLDEDAGLPVRVVVCFLSDGAPSDHNEGVCEHGVHVWASCGRFASGRSQLNVCGDSVRQCRADIKSECTHRCVRLIEELGDKFGRDRVGLHTVAFGPAQEDYAVLQQMAQVLPRSSFQKLGLAAGNLVTAFSSLSSTLTTMRTEGGGHRLTLRTARAAPVSSAHVTHTVAGVAGWHIYTGDKLVSKKAVSPRDRHSFHHVPLCANATGVAMMGLAFGQGAERMAFKCTEVGPAPGAAGRAGELVAMGQSLVAKETLFEEQLCGAAFHRGMAKVHAEGSRLAAMFNTRVHRALGVARGDMVVRFAPCVIYEVFDDHYDGGRAWILAEPFLQGRFTKWNNNNGALEWAVAGGAAPALTDVEHVPQVFSHFSWSVTDGAALLCDLQGVWNHVDGYTFTDPAMHHDDRVKPAKVGQRRSTDKGAKGIDSFFASHRCGALCLELGLAVPSH